MRVIASTWPSEAAILVGNGAKHSAYELYVTNFGKTPLKIVALNVQGKKDDEVVMTQTSAGKQLAAMFVPAATDEIFPPELSKRAAERYKAQGGVAEVVVIDGDGGHLEGVFNVAKQGEAIRSFLAR